MSDVSPQLGSQIALLLSPGQTGGPTAAGPLRPPGALSGAVSGQPGANTPTSSQSLAGIDFAQALQALLNRVENAEALPADPLPAGLAAAVPVETAIAGLQGRETSRTISADRPLTALNAGGGKTLPAGGSLLPPGGNSLPPSSPATLTPAVGPDPDAPIVTPEPAARALTAGAEVPADPDTAVDARLRSAADELMNRILKGEAPPRPAAELTPAADRPADGRALNAAAAVPQMLESLRQTVLSDGRLRIGTEGRGALTPEGEFLKGALGDLLAARADAARVTASADTATAQFNLNARPADGLLTMPQPASTDSLLRDLQSMMPLRPQSGEANQAFAQGLGQRLVMMAENGIESARLRLSPANLGQLDIQISIEDDRAQVTFGAQHSATRDALESALPRLRELFAAQGLELTQADVEDRSGDNPADATPEQATAGVLAAASGAADNPPGAGLEPRLWTAGSRGLDIYV